MHDIILFFDRGQKCRGGCAWISNGLGEGMMCEGGCAQAAWSFLSQGCQIIIMLLTFQSILPISCIWCTYRSSTTPGISSLLSSTIAFVCCCNGWWGCTYYATTTTTSGVSSSTATDSEYTHRTTHALSIPSCSCGSCSCRGTLSTLCSLPYRQYCYCCDCFIDDNEHYTQGKYCKYEGQQQRQ